MLDSLLRLVGDGVGTGVGTGDGTGGEIGVETGSLSGEKATRHCAGDSDGIGCA